MNNIREIRKIRRLSQKELAEIIGTSSVNISYLEIKKRGLSEVWIEKLSKALNCTKAQLLGEQSIEDLGRLPKDIKNEQRSLIYKFRVNKGLSINEIAKKLGVPRSTIWAFENGKASISEGLIKRIFEVLDISPDYLLTNNPTDISEYQPNQTVLPPLRPSLSLVSDNPYPITQKHLKYSMDIYDQVIGSNRHFEEEKIAILYEIYKIVYDFFENQHHQESDISTIEVQAKAMQGVSDLLRRKKKSE